MKKSTFIQFIKFSLVGLISFVIDVFAMWVFSHWLPLVLARAVAFVLAVLTNWVCHRLYTFKSHASRQAKLKEAITFLTASLVGMIPNVGIYWWIVHSDWYVNYHSMSLAPLIAMIPGIVAGQITNFVLSKYWVFKEQPVVAVHPDH
ncbi:GtrA family protein [Marinomonas mediterranea]|jgi:Predicted membrane protein|uniref:GtrA family protein n=1 Tax=Marinomonas mediterranea (strain ATCC 700492 / JCM 21426 / NBRC 103028 / MMB-1) TaxID=717774 RepID=F2JY61_MARM1|nr:GtrA family protein [Marinomonas mediterranea]ADZ90797.1 GtrA family protein [Marinomonas mediterranea MMB-1]WCN16951.1 GtrA family protein [Marinomonas mediterranea MMB-1]